MKDLRNLNTLVLIPLIILLIAGCKKETEPVQVEREFGKEFYPTRPGTFRDYQVDTAFFNVSVGPDTVERRFYVREVTDSVVVLNATDTTYLVRRFMKNALSDPDWRLLRLWAVTSLPEGVLRVEENVQTLALKFPFKKGSSWNGNQYNAHAQETRIFRVRGFSPFAQATLHLDSTVIVDELRDSSCLRKTDIVTRYARAVGPVERFRSYLEYVQDPQNPCSGRPVIRSMGRYSQKLIGYGDL